MLKPHSGYPYAGIRLHEQEGNRNSQSKQAASYRPAVRFCGGTTLVATALHGIVAIVWAVADQLLGALSEARSAILYSLNRDYKLRACQSRLERPMAPHGSTGGAERVAPVLPVGRVLVRDDSANRL